jgi:hypothetical protein
MLADAMQVVGARAEVAPLLGTWVNSMPGTDHLAKVVMTERDGELLVRPYGSAAGDLVDWGETVATPYSVSGTTEVAGFHARYELGQVHTELAANEKLGILVIQSYTSFHDGSGRLGHYAREFFHQPPAAPAATDHGRTALVGDWVNSNPASGWITGFTLTKRAGTCTLRVASATEPTDWGEVEITTYQDNIGEPAFHAEYDLGPVTAVLAANTNKSLIIVAAFLRFADTGRTNFLSREFYYRR